jgi:hypothetical protein
VKSIRIGSGAGYSGDRIEPAVELAMRGDISYLVFECLAERTIALAQLSKLRDPAMGYDPLLVARMNALLKICVERKIKIITNMGAANPLAAAAMICKIAAGMGLRSLKIAAVTGDDVLDVLKNGSYCLQENGTPIASLGDALISANAYLGASPIVNALANGADVVITGRVADPALFLSPLIHEFSWPMTDWDRLGKGTLAGHLLECAGQVTGGYFADPGLKDVEGLGHLGFPIAEVDEAGTVAITKVAGSGGAVTPATCKEQLLYEIHDPARYLTPDVIADFSNVQVESRGCDRVAVSGATGHPQSDTLKVCVGVSEGYIGEGQISYGGTNALARAKLARDIISERLKIVDAKYDELRFDFVGYDAIRRNGPKTEPCDVRLRVAARTKLKRDAVLIGNEVEALYTSGPAGGGGASKSVRQIIAMFSTMVPRQEVRPAVSFFEV